MPTNTDGWGLGFHKKSLTNWSLRGWTGGFRGGSRVRQRNEDTRFRPLDRSDRLGPKAAGTIDPSSMAAHRKLNKGLLNLGESWSRKCAITPSRVSLKLTPSEAIIQQLTAASQTRPELISRIDFAVEVMPAGCLKKN